MIKMWRAYSIFLTLIKMDVMGSIVILLVSTFLYKVMDQMGLFFVSFDWIISYVGLSIGTLISIVVAPIVVHFGVRRENYTVTSAFLLWCLVQPGYLVYKIVDVLKPGKIKVPPGSTYTETTIKVMLITIGLYLFSCLIINEISFFNYSITS